MVGDSMLCSISSARIPRSYRPSPWFLLLATANLVFLTTVTQRPSGSTSFDSNWHSLTTYIPASPLAAHTVLRVPTRKAPPPPATCDHCLLEPEDPMCEYGRDNIKLSRAFDGSGVRVRRMLAKALRGEPIRIGIIGASVTVGHGMPLGTIRWWEQFQQDFVKMFPDTTFYNGAVSAMDSSFFSSCFGSTLPTDCDLFLTELDINNEHSDATFLNDDALHRGLLSLPQEPAVMRVSVFSIIFQEMTRGYTSTLAMSHWHDVPVIGLRNWLLPHVMRHEESLPDFFGVDQWLNTDYRHVGIASHRALGDMISLYMREQVCETKLRETQPSLAEPKNGTIWPLSSELGGIPSKHMWFPFFTQKPIAPTAPACQLAGAPKTPLIATHTHGNWTNISWNGKTALVADTPGAAASFQFTGTQLGVYVWVSGRIEYGAGGALCWIDGSREEGTYVEAWKPGKDSDGPILFPVAKDLAYGTHFLTCEVAPFTATGGHEWRLIGIASL